MHPVSFIIHVFFVRLRTADDPISACFRIFERVKSLADALQQVERRERDLDTGVGCPFPPMDYLCAKLCLEPQKETI